MIQQGISSSSIQWGAWSGAGMAAGDRSTALRVERLGMGMVTPASGLEVLLTVLNGVYTPLTVATAVPFKWPAFIQRISASSGSVPPIFAAFEVEAAKMNRFTGATYTTGSSKRRIMLRQRFTSATGQPAKARAAVAQVDQQQVTGEVQAVANAILGRYGI